MHWNKFEGEGKEGGAGGGVTCEPMPLEGSGVQSGGGGGGLGMNWLVAATELFFQPFSSQGDLFLWSLKNMSVSFRVKDQCQAAFHTFQCILG